ncbi:MAG TPA: protein tyrosine phosphatase [Acidimicrobiales bacterium]|nr:protein tyrosine phosphatase [Acidimicrobiales bacterium]
MPPWHLGVICTGNICRSPMAEVVYRDLVARDEVLRDRVEVTSAGTACWHVGSAMDSRAQSALRRTGFEGSGTPGAYADRRYLASLDLAVVMTREHRIDIRQSIGNGLEVLLVRELLDPPEALDLADPYYGDDADFDECLATIRRSGPRLTWVLRQRLDAGSNEA